MGLNAIKKQEHVRMIREWREYLMRKADTGGGFNWEILSCMKEWMERGHGELTFQATQLISGHGCFKGYTHKIGKADSSRCSFCGHPFEDNLHVIMECKEWDKDMERLLEKFGEGRMNSLGALMRGMAVDPAKWGALLEFSKIVIDRKEQVEREEQEDSRRERLVREAADLLRELRRTRTREGRELGAERTDGIGST